MKKTVASLMLFITISVFAQTSDADKIIGSYMTDSNKGKVVISKTDNKYFGTLVWTNEPDALDRNNPIEKQRKNKIAGKVILKDFVYTGNNTWETGLFTTPKAVKHTAAKSH